jgi:hypothetical protein
MYNIPKPSYFTYKIIFRYFCPINTLQKKGNRREHRLPIHFVSPKMGYGRTGYGRDSAPPAVWPGLPNMIMHESTIRSGQVCVESISLLWVIRFS